MRYVQQPWTTTFLSFNVTLHLLQNLSYPWYSWAPLPIVPYLKWLAPNRTWRVVLSGPFVRLSHNSILSHLVFWPTTTISGLLKVATISIIGCSREWKELDYENITGFISKFYTLQYQITELGDAPALFVCQTRLGLRPHSSFPV